MARLDAGTHFILAVISNSYVRDIKVIDRIPKLNSNKARCYAEEAIVNANNDAILYMRQKASNPDEVEFVLCNIPNLDKYNLEIEKTKIEAKDYFFMFNSANTLLEFNMETKEGRIHKINLFMIVDTKILKTPSSWRTSRFTLMEHVKQEGVILIVMEEEDGKFLVMCDLRQMSDQ